MILDIYKYHRRSIRLKGYDYTLPGAYFVTLASWQREEIFGTIVNGEMCLNDFGRIAHEEWFKTAEIRHNVHLYEDEFVTMPNHFHGIIWIVDPALGATRRVAPTNQVAPTKTSRTILPGSLGAILAQFKSITTKRINALRNTQGVPIWQRNYYERIIRNETELKSFWNYIDANPLRWQADQLHPSASPKRFNQENP